MGGKVKKYLVFAAEDLSAHGVIEADNENEVYDNYAEEYVATDKLFRESVNTLTVNMSFWESFFKDEKGYMREEATGEWRTDLLKRFGGDEDKVSEYAINKWHENIREMFDDNQAYADMVIKEMERYNDPKDVYFPPRLYSHCAKWAMRNNQWIELIIEEIKPE